MTAPVLRGVLIVSGTGTGVGKTVVTAAVAALAAARGDRVSVVKPAQTGVPVAVPEGDLAEVRRLTGLAAGDLVELVRYPLALAPATAARLGGLAPLDLAACVTAVAELAAGRDLVLVEGAGGLLVSYRDPPGAWTLADLAGALGAPVLVVAEPGLGTLNHTALTLEALAARGLTCAGVVLGSWPVKPAMPDLACRANVADLETLAGPLAGALAAGSGRLAGAGFLAAAGAGLGPALGGSFDAADFRRAHAAQPEE